MCPPTNPGPALKLHEFRGGVLISGHLGSAERQGSVEFLKFLFQPVTRRAAQPGGFEVWTGTPRSSSGLESCTQRLPWEHLGTADATCISQFWGWEPLPGLMAGLSGVAVEAGAASCNPFLDLSRDLVAETHLGAQFPHDASWLHTGED